MEKKLLLSLLFEGDRLNAYISDPIVKSTLEEEGQLKSALEKGSAKFVGSIVSVYVKEPEIGSVFRSLMQAAVDLANEKAATGSR